VPDLTLGVGRTWKRVYVLRMRRRVPEKGSGGDACLRTIVERGVEGYWMNGIQIEYRRVNGPAEPRFTSTVELKGPQLEKKRSGRDN